MSSVSLSSPTSSRLDWADPFRLKFEAKVIGTSNFGEKASVLLDQSAFYPESGGQMGDHGTLTTTSGALVHITDTQIDSEGQVHHLVDAAPEIVAGEAVGGVIDAARRREFAALHTGQHVLSSALMKAWGAETVSSRLGETGCNIDLDKSGVNEAKLAEAEALANSVVDAALEVRQFFPTEAELGTLQFRRTPKVTDGIRVVTVGDFDVTPCGGTHVKNAAEIGCIRITQVERAKGKVRVMFESGPRARRTLFATHRLVRELASSMTCGVDEVPHAIDKLRESLSQNRSALGAARAQLAEHEVASLLSTMDAAHGAVVAGFDGDAAFLRQMAPRLIEGGAKTVVLCGQHSEGVALLCVRGPDQDGADAFDCGAFVKAAAAEFGGRGGGKAQRAEGRLDVSADVAGVLEKARMSVKRS